MRRERAQQEARLAGSAAQGQRSGDGTSRPRPPRSRISASARAIARGAALAVALQLGPALGAGAAEPPPPPVGRAAEPPADATVVASTGAAAFQIPIELPPGPGGLRPELSLAYSSLAGDGPLGVGWRLRLGEIRCTARFGVPDYASCPQFERDGELLLGPDADGHYHAFVESFERIRRIAVPGGLAWEATGLDGTRWRYGGTENARIRHGAGPAAPVARWLLDEVRDPFGNAIVFEYDRSERGNVHPARVLYGGRVVELHYEPRPDPLHDFRGGLERIATKRLREIQVMSGDRVQQRLVLGYAAPGDYATYRSRLVSLQRFGADCPPFPNPLSGCSALPAQTFAYTDPGDAEFATPDGSQWPADPGWPWVSAGEGGQLADVDGDGLPDLIRAECRLALHAWPCTDPDEGVRAVHLNTGSGYDPVPDPLWSAALADLVWDAPALRVVQMGYGALGDAGACKALPASYPSGVFFTWRDNHAGALDVNALEVVTDPESGRPMQTIGAEAHWRVVDLNGDGRADLVASTRVGGMWQKWTSDCQGDAPDTWVEAVGRAVFLNDGSGWTRAPSLEAGLPVLAAMEISDHFGNHRGSDDFDYCSFTGWWGRDAASGFPPAVCRQMVHYPVDFVELDGDGRLDILASLPLDPRYLPFYEQGACPYYDLCPFNPDRTLAFVQRRDASGEWVWERDERFDLRDPVTDEPLHHRHLVWSSVDLSGQHGSGAGSFFSIDDGFRFADLNDDGLTDVVWRDPYIASGHPHPNGPSLAVGALLNTGAGWCASAPGAPCEGALRLVPPVAVSAEPTPLAWVYLTRGLPELRDTSGDGLPDYYLPELNARLRLFDPGAAAGTTAWRADASGRFDGGLLAQHDHDGDGAVDQWVSDGGPLVLGRSGSRLPDLLRRWENGRGGTIVFAYTTAAAQRDTALEAEAAAHATALEPGVAGEVLFTRAPVVQSVRVEGPNRAPATTRYAYARPAWCPAHQVRLGFRLVRETRPDASQVDRFFHQQHGRAGRLAEQIVRAEGRVLHRVTETWALVDPSGVTGAWAGDGSVAPGSGEPARVARLVARRHGHEYGAAPGALTEQIFSYDDAFGFGFLRRVETRRPSTTVRTTRLPRALDADAREAWLVALPSAIAHEALDPDLLLSLSTFTYHPSGRPRTTTRYRRSREDAAAPYDALTTSFDYDARGNLMRRVDPLGRAVEHCYDGNPGSLAWCASAEGTGSVLVAVRDAAGRQTRITADPVFGITVAVDPDYRDQPARRIALDAFGRSAAEFATPEGGDEVQLSATTHHDGAAMPWVLHERWADPGSSDAIRSARFGDGFGGVWKEVEEIAADPSGAARFTCTATYHDAPAASRRVTHPLASDLGCSGISGAAELPATETVFDAMGRPLRTSTPDGTTLAAYGAASEAIVLAPGVLAEAAVDTVLTRNAAGHLLRRGLDGERVLWVDECASSLDPAAPSLDGVACTGADRTLYGYQGRGELEVVYDAVAVAAEAWSDPRHHSRHHFDTLGQPIRIDDPDAGTSRSGYDDAGNLAWAIDARGRVRAYAYDALDRLIAITTPPGEPNVSLSYREDEMQSSGEVVGSYATTLWYDGFGRLAVQSATNAGRSLAALYEYDLLGRSTKIRYHGLGPGIRYEYEGPALARVCRDLACSNPGAVAYVADIAYDALGRRTAMTLPGGTRSFVYEEAAAPAEDRRRLRAEAFLGTGPDGLALSLAYESYDPLGNLLSWTVDAAPDGLDASGAYEYDRRNRLVSWTRNGQGQGFAYDALGNRIVHADALQHFEHPEKPHALTSRPGTGASYGHDAAGNVTSIQRPGASRHFSYDSASRLRCIGSAPGQCDLLEVFYDASGRRIREVAGDTTRRFLGDGLVSTHDAGSGRLVYRMEVFAEGERVAVTEFETPPGRLGDAILLFGRELSPLWLAPAPAAALLWLLALALRGGLVTGVARRPGAAALCALLAAALAVPAPAVAGGGGHWITHRWVLCDRLGSAVVVVDEDGALLRHTRLAPFGAVDAEAEPSGPAAAGRRIFAGHPQQEETGLLYMGARWYDAETGAFLSVDPITRPARPQRLHGYAYAGNNPVSRIDPTGMESSIYRYHDYVGRGGSLFFFNVTEVGGGNAPGSFEIQHHGFVSPAELGGLGARLAEMGNGGLAGAPALGAEASLQGGDTATPTGGGTAEATGGGLLGALRTIAGAIGGALASLATIGAWDLALAATGALGNVFGLALGAASVAFGLVTLNLPLIGFGLHQLGWALVPRYGFWSGPGWGLPNLRHFGWWFGPFSAHNGIEAATYTHDFTSGTPGAHRQLLHDVWSRHDLGPYGQVYRVGMTAAFGALILAGADD